jgi:hypothetical protein
VVGEGALIHCWWECKLVQTRMWRSGARNPHSSSLLLLSETRSFLHYKTLHNMCSRTCLPHFCLQHLLIDLYIPSTISLFISLYPSICRHSLILECNTVIRAWALESDCLDSDFAFTICWWIYLYLFLCGLRTIYVKFVVGKMWLLVVTNEFLFLKNLSHLTPQIIPATVLFFSAPFHC